MSNLFKFTGRYQVFKDNRSRIDEDLSYQISSSIDMKNGERYTINSGDELEITFPDQANALRVLSDTPLKFSTSPGDNLVQFSVDTSTDLLTTSENVYTWTPQPVSFTSSGTLPSPLLEETTYYSVSRGENEFFISVSETDALNGTVIDITDAGTGIHNVVLDNYENSSKSQSQQTELILNNTNVKKITLRNDSGSVAGIQVWAVRSAV